ncbi:hypothetical protein [Rhizobium sp. R693]|uniref:hypothetical protein n=1 Tax=Rhizobium sp. R693 TaxID=1764276 RepID=UPI000B535A24|nr:hypothetical protein [Rhizobium sp. R693]OWV99995.1 hypothetical protein ATY79_01175 [Rhizobium sp. R693]
METLRKMTRLGMAVALAAIATACSTNSDAPRTTGSVGYGAHNADFALRPACSGGFGNDRPCSY